MLAVIASGINLAPDWTFVIQLGVFLSAVAVLYVFVFGPTFRILDMRKKFTTDARCRADELADESNRMEEERKKAVATAHTEVDAERMRVVREADIRAGQIVADAREKSSRLINAQAKAKSKELASLDVESEAKAIADSIISRVIKND